MAQAKFYRHSLRGPAVGARPRQAVAWIRRPGRVRRYDAAMTDSTAPLAPTDCVNPQFHPLEIFPVFKRIRPSAVARLRLHLHLEHRPGPRDPRGRGRLRAAPAGAGRRRVDLPLLERDRLHDPRAVHAGRHVGLDAWVRRHGHFVKTVVLRGREHGRRAAGLRVDGVVLDPRLLRQWLRNPQWLAAFAFTSLVISVVLSSIFFWRERHATRARRRLQTRAAAHGAHRAGGDARQPARAAGADRAALPLQHARQRDEPRRSGSREGEAHAGELHPLPARLARRHAQRLDDARRPRPSSSPPTSTCCRSAWDRASRYDVDVRARSAGRRRCRRCCCSPWSRTRSATASSPRWKAAWCAFARASRRRERG